jgi:nucleoside phosphorylase/tetratricopeptide (TPR) repeat protein
MVPRRRDPHFVGRVEELADLEKSLVAAGNSALTQPVIVHGLSGVGKTLLAVEFAYRHAADYTAVLWLAAENPTALAAFFAGLAGELGLPEANVPDQAERTAAVLRWLRSPESGRWLLVFDNARRREEIEPYVPPRHQGDVLITSQNPDWQPLAAAIPVKLFPRKRSVELLRKVLPGAAEADADRLADTLGDLPLALAQAAAFVQQTGRTIASYLEKFQARFAEFDREQRAEPGYGRTVAVTLELALERLKQDPEGIGPAEALLARCAFFAPERIPRELLSDETLNEAMLDQTIRTLRKYSLVETDVGAVTVHRLVQLAVRCHLQDEDQAKHVELAVRKIHSRFPSEPADLENWPLCQLLLEHSLRAVEFAMAQSLAGVPCGELLNRVGIYLCVIHDLEKAKIVLQQAVRLFEVIYGPDHPETAIILDNLGNVAREAGDFSDACHLQERALRIAELHLGPVHPEVARILGSLGNSAQSRGDLAGARRLLDRALSIEERFFGSNHIRVARTLNNLGEVARKLGDSNAARTLQERALSIKESCLGPDHPDLASTLNNLGVIAQEQGGLAEALRFHERALQFREVTHGPDHPQVASTLDNLGIIAAQQGNLAKARSLLERSLRIKESYCGPDHPQLALTLDNLGVVLWQQGDLPAGRRLLERALRIKEVRYGPSHPEVASTLDNLGLVAVQQKDLAEARRLQERALLIEESHYGLEHPQVAITLVNLGLVVQGQGDLAKARQFEERALRILEKFHGPKHSQVAVALINLAGVLVSDGESEQALALINRAIEIFKAEFGECHPNTTQALDYRMTLEAKIHKGPPMTDVSQDKPMGQSSPEKLAPTIGIITALPHETAALLAVFGEPPRINVPGSGAGRSYWRAELPSRQGGVHHVVIAQADMGNNIAAVRASLLLTHFTTVESIIMCGIAGGIPDPFRPTEHVRLGDVIVSNQKGVVQYDFVKRTIKRKRKDVPEEVRAAGHRPSAELLEAVRILEANKHLGKFPWEELLQEGLTRLKWARPDDATDVLADPADDTKTIKHPDDSTRRPSQPRIFLAPIASANTLLKDPTKRESLHHQHGTKAVEMEGSGIQDATWTHGVGYLVVRGVCDYCDSKKNDVWQHYAATAAAAYVRALLETIPGHPL